MDTITVKGKKLETMPPELYIIAALVKRLGGEIIISNKELDPINFTGVLISRSDNNFYYIRVN